jgi:alkanesulfonate monooxygenase SsuD/methylene tetrahydromethanopterin reductase-like flavin-dependent oxidoreductase (luciferase family)
VNARAPAPARHAGHRGAHRASPRGVAAHFPHLHDLFVALTFAVAATTTLKLGTGICLVAERDPIVTAKMVASLDVLSSARVLFGAGVGWVPEETANHGVEPGQRWR